MNNVCKEVCEPHVVHIAGKVLILSSFHVVNMRHNLTINGYSARKSKDGLFKLLSYFKKLFGTIRTRRELYYNDRMTLLYTMIIINTNIIENNKETTSKKAKMKES